MNDQKQTQEEAKKSEAGTVSKPAASPTQGKNPNSAILSDDELQELSEKIETLEAQLTQAKNNELRALADYSNLQRRSREDHSHVVKVATQSLVSDLLEPLEHLAMTAEQMKNSILDMVLTQLWAVLNEHGLEEIKVLDKPFDLETMEVVDLVDGATEQDGKVVKIVKRGYILNGKVLQHAKVVMGKK